MSTLRSHIAQLPFEARVSAIRAEIFRSPNAQKLSDAEVQRMAVAEAKELERPRPTQLSQPAPQMCGYQMQMFMAFMLQMMQSMLQLGGGFSSFLGGPQTPPRSVRA